MADINNLPPAGTRVRVTFEGVVKKAAPDDYLLWVMANDGSIESIFSRDEISAPTFHIEVLLEPLKVGRAEVKGTGRKGRVSHTDDEYAWFVADDGSVGGDIWHVSKLRNIPEDE